MVRRRLILFGFVAIVTLGAVALTGGYGWYLRSDGYRARCAKALSESLSLPSDIGAVVPLSRESREFRDVAVWLPERRGRALTCHQALVVNTPSADDPNSYEIRLTGGDCEISTRTWLRQDYRGVIESGLRPGFTPDGPRLVTFVDMNLSLNRDRFRAELREAAGQVDFRDPHAGHASIMCREFNGYRPSRPVLLDVRFSPRKSGIRIDRLDLTTPELPLSVARLSELAGVGVTSGRFSGELRYEEDNGDRLLVVSGRCFDLELPECTAGLTPVPWRGRCPEIELQELRVENDSAARLRFRGVVTDLALGDILTVWGCGGVAGTLTLEVGVADLLPRSIEQFVASGRGVAIDLASLSESLGWGTMTGRLNITINDLTIVENRLKSLDATLVVEDAADEPNWIEGRLLRELISRALKVELPAFLPERIEYTRLGVKLEVRDELLYVFGTHGERERTILTVRLFDRDVPLVFEPRHSFDLEPVFDDLRARAAERLEQQLGLPVDGD